jgi:hypothetical protein
VLHRVGGVAVLTESERRRCLTGVRLTLCSESESVAVLTGVNVACFSVTSEV